MRSFVASVDSLREIRGFVRALAEDAGLTAEDADALVLATHEAAANAARHSGSAVVRVGARVVPDGLEVEVADDGAYPEGPRDLPGLGLSVMAATADSITIRRGSGARPGTVVQLVKLVRSGAGARGDGGAAVVVLEPDRFARRSLGTFLNAEGFRVTLAGTLEEARAEASRSAPDVLVADVTRDPATTAWCASIRSEGSRVVAVSTFETDAAGSSAFADAFLPKPLHPLQLLAAIRRVADRRSPAPGAV